MLSWSIERWALPRCICFGNFNVLLCRKWWAAFNHLKYETLKSLIKPVGSLDFLKEQIKRNKKTEQNKQEKGLKCNCARALTQNLIYFYQTYEIKPNNLPPGGLKQMKTHPLWYRSRCSGKPLEQHIGL